MRIQDDRTSPSRSSNGAASTQMMKNTILTRAVKKNCIGVPEIRTKFELGTNSNWEQIRTGGSLKQLRLGNKDAAVVRGHSLSQVYK